jgi:hypothetical protein
MSLILQGSTSGSITLQEPAVAGTTVLDLPATSGNVVVDSATQTLTNKTIQGGTITSGTAVASTSGTSIDFTSIPSWVKRITVMFDGVSSNGTSGFKIQIGTGGSPTTSGYSSTATVVGSGTASAVETTGFAVIISGQFSAAGTMQGISTICLLNSSTNTWAFNSTVATTNLVYSGQGGGAVALSGILNMIRVTTNNGTDTFDAGTINILYE